MAPRRIFDHQGGHDNAVIMLLDQARIQDRGQMFPLNTMDDEHYDIMSYREDVSSLHKSRACEANRRQHHPCHPGQTNHGPYDEHHDCVRTQDDAIHTLSRVEDLEANAEDLELYAQSYHDLQNSGVDVQQQGSDADLNHYLDHVNPSEAANLDAQLIFFGHDLFELRGTQVNEQHGIDVIFVSLDELQHASAHLLRVQEDLNSLVLAAFFSFVHAGLLAHLLDNASSHYIRYVVEGGHHHVSEDHIEQLHQQVDHALAPDPDDGVLGGRLLWSFGRLECHRSCRTRYDGVLEALCGPHVLHCLLLSLSVQR